MPRWRDDLFWVVIAVVSLALIVMSDEALNDGGTWLGPLFVALAVPSTISAWRGRRLTKWLVFVMDCGPSLGQGPDSPAARDGQDGDQTEPSIHGDS